MVRRRTSVPKTPFAARLKRLREAHGVLIGSQDYTAKDFAEALGIEAETYRTYERGISAPNIDMLAKIRKVTGVSLNALICGEDDIEPAKGRTPLKVVRH